MIGNYGNLGKLASQELAKNTYTFGAGQTLIALIPYINKDNANGERPWLEATVIQFPEDTGLKRSMLVSNVKVNPLLDAESFKATLVEKGKQLPAFDYVGDGLKSPQLVAFQKKDPKTNQPVPIRDSTLHLYAMIVLATRADEKKTWSGAYTKPQILSAKKGGKQVGLHDEIMRCFSRLDGNDKIAELFADPACPDRNVRLLVVTRTGLGITDTKWGVALAEGEQKAVDAPYLGDKFDGRQIKLPASIFADIAAGLKADIDLIPYVAGTFMPSNEELAAFCANLNIGVKKTAEMIEKEMRDAAEAQRAGGAASTVTGGKKTAAG